MKRYKRRQKRGYAERAGYTNEHHNLPRSRGGTSTLENVINLDERRHAAYHLLFKDMTFGEAASLLWRAERIMRRKDATVKIGA